ncbi:MAG: lysophospholipid acyltransferase family protein [Spirochaetales bacterium]
MLFMVYLLSALVYWDLSMKLRDAVSRRWARRYLNRRLSTWCRQLLSVANLCTGFKVQFERDTDTKLSGPVLVVSNHQSLIDIVAVSAALPELNVRFVAKAELRRGFPGVSQALRLQQHALVPRSGHLESGLAELRRLARLARTERACPVVFPEGTRSRSAEVLEFRTGALRVILSEQSMPILVTAVHGGYRLRTLRMIARNFDNTVYYVGILAQLPPPTTRSELNEYIAQAEEMIRERVSTWHAQELQA